MRGFIPVKQQCQRSLPGIKYIRVIWSVTQVLVETNPFFKAVKIERAQRGILSKGNEKRQHKVVDVIALGLATNISLVREGKRHKM